jgi:uracil-DNA glycosylase family 4
VSLIKHQLAKGDYPEWTTKPPPKNLNKNRTIDGVLHFAGVGNKKSDVMFFAPCVMDEEANDRTSPARLLKGPSANLFFRNLRQVGIDPASIYYTTLCKYTLPRGRKMKPKLDDLRWCHTLIEQEIKEVSPKLIVCLGKQVFDYFVDFRATFKDVHGGFFHSAFYDCMVYVTDQITTPFYKPEFISRFLVDIGSVKTYLDDINGVGVPKVETNYRTVKTVKDFYETRKLIEDSKTTYLSVDCEWGGATYVDGKLRSIQLCWAPGQASYIMFRDQEGLWVWEEDEALIYSMVGTFLNKGFKFIAHSACSDFVWMEHHLGVDTHAKCLFDTMYAEFLLDEYSDLKLERLSVKYTDLGRYDTELFLIKKKLNVKSNEGYERIPDDILIPYACKDVDVVIRAYPILMRKLYESSLQDYYYNINLPYVTDSFKVMAMTGVPINKAYLDVMRTVFTNNEVLLLVELRMAIKQEATLLLGQKLYEKFGAPGAYLLASLIALDERRIEITNNSFVFPYVDIDFVPWDTSEYESDTVLKKYLEPDSFKEDLLKADIQQIKETLVSTDTEAYTLFKGILTQDTYAECFPFFEHWWDCHYFNLRSEAHKRRWFFDVRYFIPVKTTKKDGIQMPWESVLKLDENRRHDFSPSTDKETITIYAENCPLIAKVLELNSVGNIVKMFLKGPDANGNEQGLHKWIQSDGRLHCNFSTTETGRPRTWNPNVLNYPKAITRPIESAFKRLGQNKPYSLRSCVEAPDGWCLVDADLETAEVLGLAYIAGDKEMIEVCSAKDPDFVAINPEAADLAGVPWSKFKGVSAAREVNLVGFEHCIVHDDAGELIRPLRDMHWEMAETMHSKPRESLEADIDRLAGKIGMFSIPYGASATLLERTIEGITGQKPDQGTGDNLIKAYETKFPVAASFLKGQEFKVEDPGYYRSISGRLRHFHMHSLGTQGLTEYARKSLLAPLTREARNYPMQEIVAATMARAVNSLVSEFRDLNMKASPMILLHDALTVMCPIEERWKVKELLHKCMSYGTTWEIHGETLKFEIDVDFSYRWGMKPSEEEKELLNTM